MFIDIFMEKKGKIIMEKNDKLQLVPLEAEMNTYSSMAAQAVRSKLYRNYGDTAAVMTMMLSARELGISPMAALNGGLNIIQGKVEISARMMNAMIRRSGHSINTNKSTDEICELTGKRADNDNEETVSFSLEEAKKAGLVKPSGGWQKFPSDMLYARALSRLARRLFPDVIGCSYVEGEIVEAKVEVVEPEKPKDAKEMLKDFISTYDKEEAMYLSKYIKQIHDKFELTYEQIIKKMKDDPEKSSENYKKWKEKYLCN